MHCRWPPRRVFATTTRPTDHPPAKPTHPPTHLPTHLPTGLVPEDLLRQLVACRVDYHFARINSQTDIMCEIFKKVCSALGWSLQRRWNPQTAATTRLPAGMHALCGQPPAA